MLLFLHGPFVSDVCTCLANDSCVTCARVHCVFAGTLLKERLWRTSHSWLHWYRAAGSAPMLWILFLRASNCLCKAVDVTCVTICAWNRKSVTHSMSVSCATKNSQGHDLGMPGVSWVTNTRVRHMMQCALHATVRNIHAVTVLGSNKNKIFYQRCHCSIEHDMPYVASWREDVGRHDSLRSLDCWTIS